jgi:serine O-acetyltransferase
VKPNHERQSGVVPHAGDEQGSKRSLSTRLVAKLQSLELPISSRAEVARFLRLVREDLKAYDGDWTRPGFQALLVHRFGVWRMSIRPKLLRAPFSVTSRALFVAVRNLYGIELPFTARIGRRVIFEHQHGIVVHGNAVIGDDCIIRQGVTLGIRRLDRLTEAPVLGRAVNVGAGAKILGHVFVGDHAEIGANSVVLENVPPHGLAVGIPARQVTRHNGRPLRRERSARAIPERSTVVPSALPMGTHSNASLGGHPPEAPGASSSGLSANDSTSDGRCSSGRDGSLPSEAGSPSERAA